MSLQTILSAISSFIWGPPLLILLSGTGLYLTLRLGFLQIRYLPRALGYLFARGANKGKGDVSYDSALHRRHHHHCSICLDVHFIIRAK